MRQLLKVTTSGTHKQCWVHWKQHFPAARHDNPSPAKLQKCLAGSLLNSPSPATGQRSTKNARSPCPCCKRPACILAHPSCTAEGENPFYIFGGSPYTLQMALDNSFVHVPRKDQTDRLTQICANVVAHCPRRIALLLTVLLVHLRSVDLGVSSASPNASESPRRVRLTSPCTKAAPTLDVCRLLRPPLALHNPGPQAALPATPSLGADTSMHILPGRSASTGARIPYNTDQICAPPVSFDCCL